MKHIFFDTNVWRIVARPECHQDDPEVATFDAIKALMKAGEIAGYISETVFTVEAIKRKDRKTFLADYHPKVSRSVEATEDGCIHISMKVSPDSIAHPGNNEYLEKYMPAALDAGLRIVRVPRISGVQNSDMVDTLFQPSNLREFQETAFAVLREIEARNAGFAHLKNLGKRYSDWWLDGIRQAPDSENKRIAKAVAEWADGDSVACSIALGCQYFCTRDHGKNAGAHSILSDSNVKWLENNYSFKRVSAEQLLRSLV